MLSHANDCLYNVMLFIAGEFSWANGEKPQWPSSYSQDQQEVSSATAQTAARLVSPASATWVVSIGCIACLAAARVYDMLDQNIPRTAVHAPLQCMLDCRAPLLSHCISVTHCFQSSGLKKGQEERACAKCSTLIGMTC